MITTNKTKLPEAANKPGQVLTTNDRKPREFNFSPRTIAGVQPVATRKVTGPMMTTDGLERRSRGIKRSAAIAEIKANRLAATTKAEPAEIEKRRPGRPRRDDHV